MVIAEPTVGRVSGLLAIPLVMRLSTRDGAFDGVLVTALDPERLVHVFRSIRVGERSTVGIMDREGKLYVWSASTDPIPAGLSAPTLCAIRRAPQPNLVGQRHRAAQHVLGEPDRRAARALGHRGQRHLAGSRR